MGVISSKVVSKSHKKGLKNLLLCTDLYKRRYIVYGTIDRMTESNVDDIMLQANQRTF